MLDSFISVLMFEVPHFIYYLIILCDKFLSMFPPDQLPKEGQLQCEAPQFSGRGGGNQEE